MADKQCIADTTVEREQISLNGSTSLFNLESRHIFLVKPNFLEFALSGVTLFTEDAAERLSWFGDSFMVTFLLCSAVLAFYSKA